MSPDWAMRAAMACYEDMTLANDIERLLGDSKNFKNTVITEMAVRIRMESRRNCEHCGASVERRCAC